MKAKAVKYILLIISFMASSIIMSQEYFYYYGGNKIPLKLDTQSIYISTKINNSLPYIANTSYVNIDTINESYLNNNILNAQIRHHASIYIESKMSNKEYLEFISSLMENNKDIIVSPSFNSDENSLGLSEYFYVCLNQLSDTTLLRIKSNETNIRIVAQDRFMENWFTLAVTEDSNLNSLEAANIFYESGLFKYAEPDFMIENQTLSSDYYYSQQWGVKNTGQHNGVAEIDMKVEQAWNYSTGENVIVAVIDKGIQLNHPDLENNIYHLSYDTQTDSSPSIVYGYHGSACAGIIGAIKDNDIGIAGIAPDCKLMSISNTLMPSVLACRNIANGINWAWINGADIISNSYKALSSEYINDAIDNAANNGRNGHGCVLFYASGNDNSPSISYPSSLTNTIAVGAISPCGERKSHTSCDGIDSWGSNYGDGLDIVAPGIFIPTTSMGDDYMLDFSGTSSACPHAAGVAALMLSVNPNLTRQQITDIIKRTAQKVGNYNYQTQNNDPQMTWCPEIGYGLIDAHKSVIESILYSTNPTLNGYTEMSLCDNYFFSCDIINPELFSYEWSFSNNLTAVSVEDNMIELRAITSGSAWVNVKVYSENRLIRTFEINNISITESHVGALVPLSNSILSFTQNTTLNNNNHYLVYDAIVEENVTVTITGTVYCSDIASIKVKPGGKLILDGGNLISVCNSKKWRGIEVWGNDNMHQHEINGQYYQGVLEMKNGATIENAVCAVELWNPMDNNSEGGIIFATDAIFKNNARAVHALNYTNYNSGIGTVPSYNASFNNCSFIIDSNYIGNDPFFEHVNLSNVSGINFYGCSFSDNRNLSHMNDNSCAIYAIDASFNVDQLNNPNPFQTSESLIKSSFNGFLNAIYIINTGTSLSTFSVTNSTFINNAKGIFAQNIGYAAIVSNSFDIGYNHSDCSFGLYLDNISNFMIEENTFTGSAIGNDLKYGIVINSSSSINDIYHNEFSNLNCGNVALGNNIDNIGNGLTYTCNTNTNNIIDILIHRTETISGIALNQGSINMAAGNTFSGTQYYIYNNGNKTITYYFYIGDNSQYLPQTKVYNVNINGTNKGNLCSFDSNMSNVMESIEDIEELEREYNSIHTEYIQLQQIDMQNSENSEEIESQLIQLRYKYLKIVGKIVNYYLHDDDSNYEDIRLWLSKSENIFSDRMIVASYIKEGDFYNAKQYAEILQKKYNLMDDALIEHNDYVRLIELYSTLNENDRNIYELNEEELLMVKDIAENGIGESQAMADAVILANGGTSFKIPSCLTLPSTNSSTRDKQESSDFAPIGAKWYYDYNKDLLPWDYGYIQIESVSDTIIDEIACRKLIKTLYEYDHEINEELEPRIIGYEYMTQINDSVMIYRDDKFKKLYDFGAEIGDTLIVPGKSNYNGVEIDPSNVDGYAVVVDKDYIEYDGQSLKYIDIKHITNSPWQFLNFVDYENYTIRICEKIGNVFGYLLPEPHEMDVDIVWEGGGALRCYSDNMMNVSFSNKECDFIDSTIGMIDVSDKYVYVFPNPTNGNINIKLKEDLNSIYIYDSHGRMVQSSSVDGTSLSIDISHFASGLYLMVIKDDNDVHYIRIIKN